MVLSFASKKKQKKLKRLFLIFASTRSRTPVSFPLQPHFGQNVGWGANNWRSDGKLLYSFLNVGIYVDQKHRYNGVVRFTVQRLSMRNLQWMPVRGPFCWGGGREAVVQHGTANWGGGGDRTLIWICLGIHSLVFLSRPRCQSYIKTFDLWDMGETRLFLMWAVR